MWGVTHSSVFSETERETMGLIDFMREAGEDLLGRISPAAAEAPATVDTEGIVQAVRDLGLKVDDLSVKLTGDVATVTGTAASQTDREKTILVVGNTVGVASVDDQLQVAAPQPQSTYYKVQSGDTLSKIAKTHYGDAMRYPEIFEANRPMLKDPDKIYPGQVLRIPPASA